MPQYNKWWKGIGLSKNVQNTFDDMENVDIWSELGSLRCQKTLVQKDGGVVNKPCYQATTPEGVTYFFSKIDGDIFKRTADGVYSYVRSNTVGSSSSSPSVSTSISSSPSSSVSVSSSISSSPSASTSTSSSPSVSISSSVSTSPSPSASAGGSAHKGAGYYNGYIFYTTDTYLGRFDGNVSWNDFYQLLNPLVPHAIEQFDLIMYITNGKDIAQLDDAGVFTSSGLDLPMEHKATALMPYGDDLLTLSNPGDYINDSAIFRWNTYSDSWTIKDSIKEVDAYAFLDADNNVYVICSSGNIYYYNGSKLEPFSIIRNPYSTSGHQLTTNLKGKPLVANGGKVYSLYRKTRDLDVALAGEYTCSAGADATIHSIRAFENNLLVSWEKGGTYGVDEISNDYFANARIITPRFTRCSMVKVFYDDLNGGEIGIYSREDGSSNWTSHAVVDDSNGERCVKNSDFMFMESGGQVLITITPSGTDTPVITDIKIV